MVRWELPSAVDLGHAPALLEQLQAHVADADGGELHLDASAMQSFDSSLLALLLEARRRLQATGGSLIISGAAPKLRELAALYGVDELVFGPAVQPLAEPAAQPVE